MNINELYKEFIMDHGRTPKNFNVIKNATHTYEGFNHFCGDKIKIYTIIRNGIITKLSFQGKGCIVSIASASIMTELLKGKSIIYALNLFQLFINFITNKKKSNNKIPNKLSIFKNLRKFPIRIKCATLAWHTVKAAIND